MGGNRWKGEEKGKASGKGKDDGKGSSRAHLRAEAQAAREAQKRQSTPPPPPPPPARAERRGERGKDSGKGRSKGKDWKDDRKDWREGWKDDERDWRDVRQGWRESGSDSKGKGQADRRGKAEVDAPRWRPEERRSDGKGNDTDGTRAPGMNVRDLEARIGATKAKKDEDSGAHITEADSERQAISKKISWILRRGAASVGITLADGGWVTMTELIKNPTFDEITDRSEMNFGKLMSVINESNKEKPRYELKQSNEGLLIRAYTKDERKDLEERQDSAPAPPVAGTEPADKAPPPPPPPPQQQQPPSVAQLQQMQLHQVQLQAAQQQMVAQQQQQQMAAQPYALQQMALAAQMASQQQQQQQQFAAAQRAKAPGAQPPDYQQMAQAFAAAGQALAAALKMPAVPGQPGVQSVGGPFNPAAPALASTPAVAGSSGMPAGAATFMSAAAPTFTPLEQQHQQWLQAQAAQVQAQAQAAQFVQQQQNEELTQMWYSNSSAEQAPSSFGYQNPTKAFKILDPKTNAAVDIPASPTKTSALDYLEVKAPTQQRKVMTIVDPSSGKPVDTFTAVNFKPAEGKKLEIIDPNSGASVKI